MPIFSDIYGMVGRGVTPIEDPQNALMKALQLQGARQQAMQAQQGMADDQALREATIASGGDQNKLMQLLYGKGNYGAAQKVQKSLQDAAKAKADLEYRGAQTEGQRATTGKTLTETDAARLTQHNNLLATVASPEDGQAWVQMGVQNGAIKPENAQMLAQTFARATTPEQFRDVVNKLSLGMKDYIEKNAPKYHTQNSGQVETLFSTPGLGGVASPVSSVQKVATPGEVLTDSRTRSEGAANRSVQIRGQDLTDARSREATAATRENTAGQRIDSQTQQIAKMVESQSLPNLSASMRTLNDTLEKYKDGELPGVGRVTGYLPPMLLGEEGKKVRSQAQGVANDLLKLYSGGAVTLNESERRTIEMMQGGGFTQKDLYNAWPTIVNRYNEAVKNIEAGFAPAAVETFKKRGGSALTPITPATPGNKADNGMPADVLAALKRHGG